MLTFVLPPDGALDVPTDARVVIPDVEAVVELRIDGEAIEVERRIGPGHVGFEPAQPLPEDTWIEVVVQLPDDTLELGFHTGARQSAPVDGLPDVGPWLLATPLRGDRWSMQVDAEPPDAEPFGFFEVAWRVADGQEAVVDIAWPAQDDGPARGRWEDRTRASGYCAGVAYVDVTGRVTEPVEVCADLVAARGPDPGVGCASAPGPAGAGWALGLLLLSGRRRAAGPR